MRLPLDTHTTLWWLAGGPHIGDDAERQLTDQTNRVLLSAAVIREIAIKVAGKLQAPPNLASTFLGAGAQALPVTLDHVAADETLPWPHRDPFGRLLVAQALTENATIVSHDDGLRDYGVAVVW